ncbi:hypothetical protein NKH18_27205 [Streptomyces sp. M10(2022)]
MVVALVAASVTGYVWADSALTKGIDLGAIKDRPAPGKGTNYLIVGSDSREGCRPRTARPCTPEARPTRAGAPTP